jgi:hypothetical protein
MLKARRYVLILIVCPISLVASNNDEHWRIADSAFASVLRECGATEEANRWCLPFSGVYVNKRLWSDKTFGGIASACVESDLSLSRLHQRGKTILEQLQSLDSARLDAAIRAHFGPEYRGRIEKERSVSELPSAEIAGLNVIVNYLVHHLIALHYAESAGKKDADNGPLMARGLIYEAIAQSYLVDAFSAGKLLLPVMDPFRFLHSRNNKEAYEFYNGDGVFVLNSQGDAWRTFGEEIFEWYAPAYEHVFDACCTSLRELFLVYYGSTKTLETPNSLEHWVKSFPEVRSHREVVEEWLAIRNGEDYYSVLKMPVLLLLPVPISAAWSIRSDEEDNLGIHKRRHYPQIRDTKEEPGFHDSSDVDVDEEFIYPKTALPNWLLPETWLSGDSLLLMRLKDPSMQSRNTLASDLIKRKENVASVRYLQERYYAPSYFGFLFHAAGGYLSQGGSSSGIWSASVGYAPPIAVLPDLQLLDRLSLDLAYTRFLDYTSRQLLSITSGVSFGLYSARVGTRRPFRYLEFIRFEGGYVWGLRSPLKSHGAQFSLGLESGIIPLGFTYAGISLQLKYQLMLTENKLQGLSFGAKLQ